MLKESKMRIDNILPINFYTPPAAPTRQLEFAEPIQPGGLRGPAASVEISQEALAAYTGCETCASRRYVDQSDDSSVSFQTPTHISPEQSAALVMAHEREHIANDQARAEQEGERVISQTVSLQVSTCPECKRMYVSGGSARTVSVSDGADDQAAGNSIPGINLTV